MVRCRIHGYPMLEYTLPRVSAPTKVGRTGTGILSILSIYSLLIIVEFKIVLHVEKIGIIDIKHRLFHLGYIDFSCNQLL